MSIALYLTKYDKDNNGNFYDGSSHLLSYIYVDYETADLLVGVAPLRDMQIVETENCLDYFTTPYWNEEDISKILLYLEKTKDKITILENIYDFIKSKEKYKDDENIILKMM